MGEPESVWSERIQLLMPCRVNRHLLEMTGNPGVKFMHGLPAFHNSEIEVGKHIHDAFGIDAAPQDVHH